MPCKKNLVKEVNKWNKDFIILKEILFNKEVELYHPKKINQVLQI